MSKVITVLLIVGWVLGLFIGLFKMYKKEKEYELYK